MNQKLDKFHKYMELYEKLIKRHAKTYVGEYLAEDVTQETFLAMYERMDYLEDATVKNWLLTVSGNIAKDYLKKGGSIDTYPMEPENIIEYVKGEAQSAEDAVEKKEERKAAAKLCRTAFELLYQKNPNWYYVVVDSYMLDMSSKEIAAVLKTNAAHVDVMKHRAKSYLRRKLGRQYREFF